MNPAEVSAQVSRMNSLFALADRSMRRHEFARKRDAEAQEIKQQLIAAGVKLDWDARGMATIRGGDKE